VGSDVYYETTGFAPNSVFTIEWVKANYAVGLDGTTTSPPPPNDSRKFIEFPAHDTIINFKP
jgi:hypothetical protein